MGDTSAPEWLTRQNFAHRGLHCEGVPENSLAAAEGAIACGMGIECDVQRSADGYPVVFHDWNLKRLTGTQERLEDLQAEHLQRTVLKGSTERIVMLADFLTAIDGRAPLLIEIKSKPDYDVEPSCQAVANDLSETRTPHAVMSFDPRVPAWFAENHPNICRGLVGTDSLPNGFEHVWRSPDTLKQARADFLALDRRDLARPEAKQWRVSGKPLLTWTVRTPEQLVEAKPLSDAQIVEREAVQTVSKRVSE